MTLTQRLEAIVGQPVRSMRPLHGGMVGEVRRVDLADGSRLVAKIGTSGAMLDCEGYMLRYLRDHSQLPVPNVIHSDPTLLLMTYVMGSSSFNHSTERHAATLLAGLHNVTAPQFGLEQDTLIGSLHQPNSWVDSWIPFFRDNRLLYMAGVAYDAGRLPVSVLHRIDTLAARLDSYLIEPDAPSLIHGDVWTTNVLAQNGQITAFIDPAIYYAHPEIELAFITLFNTFGTAFFERYHELRPIEPGFFEERRDLYNLYPLLVHVRLFGGGYVNSVTQILDQFGV